MTGAMTVRKTYYIEIYKPPYPTNVEWNYKVHRCPVLNRDILQPTVVRVLSVWARTQYEAIAMALAGKASVEL